MAKIITLQLGDEFENHKYTFKGVLPLKILNTYESLSKKNSKAAEKGDVVEENEAMIYLLTTLSLEPKLTKTYLTEEIQAQEFYILFYTLLEETNQIPKFDDKDRELMKEMTVEERQAFVAQLSETRFNDLKKKQMNVLI